MLTRSYAREYARMQTCDQLDSSAYTQASKTHKHKQTHKHTPEDGSMRPKLPPVLSQLLVTRVTQLQAQLAQPQLESDEDGKMKKSQERIYIK